MLFIHENFLLLDYLIDYVKNKIDTDNTAQQDPCGKHIFEDINTPALEFHLHFYLLFSSLQTEVSSWCQVYTNMQLECQWNSKFDIILILQSVFFLPSNCLKSKNSYELVGGFPEPSMCSLCIVILRPQQWSE